MEIPICIIDGSLLEGGGQMVRIASSFACILNRSIRVINIRAKRQPRSGLGAQHATGIHLVSKISGLSIEGAIVGSSIVTFFESSSSSSTKMTTIDEDCGTAGAISLLIQVSLPVALYHSDSSTIVINLRGGTNVIASPPTDHTQNVLLPLLRNMGIDANITIKRRGFYPVGGGEVEMIVSRLSKPLTTIQLTEQGSVVHIKGIITGNVEMESLESIRRALRKSIRKTLGSMIENVHEIIDEIIMEPVDKIVSYSSSHRGDNNNKRNRSAKSSKGSTVSIQLWACTDSGSILSANSLSDYNSGSHHSSSSSSAKVEGVDHNNYHDMTEEVVQDLFQLICSGAAIDEHTADQLLIFMVLGGGVSQILVSPPSRHSSQHIESVFHVISSILNINPFTLEQLSNGCRLITVNGIGFYHR